jgi:5'-nucleotidase (lipoprotein e(P4) family)
MVAFFLGEQTMFSMRTMKTNLTLLLCLMVVSGCAVQHDSMNATLWIQTSAEYQGNSQMVFNVAESRLSLLRDKQDVTADIDQAESFGCGAGTSCPGLAAAGLIPAVVLDIDETVLDNSVYAARLIKNGGQWQPGTWDDWVSEKAAIPVPGALAFVERARAEGIAVIYVTNRRCSVREGLSESSSNNPCPQKSDTLENLLRAGYPSLASDDQLILRGERPQWDTSEKQVRRQHIAKRYRIMMLIGDDLGDLASNIKKSSVEERARFVSNHQSLLGEYWFQLTNPTYGSWQGALSGKPRQNYLRLN